MKKLLMFAATAAVVMSSCSKIEQNENSIPTKNDPDKVWFTSTTSRAANNTLENVKAGFPVYGYANNAAANTWYSAGGSITLDGTNDYFLPTTMDNSVSDFNGWQWKNSGGTIVEAPEWPAAGDNAWPMKFIAIYPEPTTTTATLTPSTGVVTASVTAVHEINTDRYQQLDLLAAAATANSKPAGGLTLNFEHILSKLDVTATAGEGLVVQVQGVTLGNVINSNGTYQYAPAQAWTLNGTAASYEYRKTVFVGSTTAPDASSWMAPLAESAAAGTVNLVQNNASDVSGSLMILPQTTPEIDLSAVATNAKVAAVKAGTYFEVLYRVSQGGVDIVGRNDVLNPGLIYDAAGVAVTPTATDTYGGYTAADYASTNLAAGDNLYIKALFPISDVILEESKYYTFNLLIGGEGTGGIYADNKYYDEAGNDTGYTHKGTPGAEVFTNKIHFIVDVLPWGDGGTTTIE